MGGRLQQRSALTGRVRPLLQVLVTNLSAVTARDTEVSIRLPRATSLVSGARCELAPREERHRRYHRHPHYRHDPQELVCTAELVPGNGSVQFAVQLKLDKSFQLPGTWIVGSVAMGSGIDSNLENNRAHALLLRAHPWPPRHHLRPGGGHGHFPGWPW